MKAILLVGSDFRLVPLGRLEQLSSRREVIQARLLEWRAHGLVRGAVLVATCNRFEVLLELADRPLPDLRQELLGVGADFPLHEHADGEALEHLLGVTTGMHSLVFGEEQIQGQVRGAFRTAEDLGMLSRRLHMLQTRLLGTARKLRHGIGLDHRPRSVAALAVERLLGQGSRFAVVGAGETGHLLVELMTRRGLPAPLVVNRTLARAEGLAEHFGGTAMSLAEFLCERPQLDGVVFAVHCPAPLWHAKDASGVRVVVDISQPSALADDVVTNATTTVHRLDDFAARAAQEQQQFDAAREVGLTEVRAFAAQLWQEIASARPNLGRVVDLHVEGAIAEFEHALHGDLRHLDERDREVVRGIMLRLAKRNAHHHICDLRQFVGAGTAR